MDWLNWTEQIHISPGPRAIYPTPLGHHRALSWAPCTKQHLPSSYLFYTFCCSLAQSCLALYNPMDCSMPSFPDLQYLSEFAETHVHWVGDAFQPFHPLSPLLLLSLIFPTSVACPMSQLFASGGQSIGSFSFSISPSNEYSGLISFRIDWFDLLDIQETLKSLLQHHSSKASALWHLDFFMNQLSHPYLTTGKNHSSDCTDLCQQNDVSAF